jgi:hypothetical protein
LSSVTELCDDSIELALTILRRTFPHIAGLQAPSLGEYCEHLSVPNFAPVYCQFVQIFHLPGHWVVGTNQFSSSSHDIFWYDSLPKTFIRKEAVVQLSSLLRNNTEEQVITVHLRNTDSQPDNTNLCGYYAIAFAVAVCHGLDPTLLRFNDPLQLVKYVTDGLRNGFFNNSLPASTSPAPLNLSVVKYVKLHCICNCKYTYGCMVTCSLCGNHYHAQCMSVVYDVCPPLLWQGPCCPGLPPQSMPCVPDPADEEVVTNCDDLFTTSSPINAASRGRRPKLTQLSPIR